jgi:hypothetical protein
VHYRVPTTAKTIRGEIAKAKADTKGRRTFSDFAFPKGPKAPAGKPVGGSRAKPAKKSGAGRRIDKRTQTVIDALRNNLRHDPEIRPKKLHLVVARQTGTDAENVKTIDRRYVRGKSFLGILTQSDPM